MAVDHHPDLGYRVYAPRNGRHLVSPDGAQIFSTRPIHALWRWQRLLLAQVLPLSATLQGLELLHASAVGWNGRDLGLVARAGTGKTSVAAHVVARGGVLVTDDVLALEDKDDGRRGAPRRRVALDRPGRADADAPDGQTAARAPRRTRRQGRAGRGGSPPLQPPSDASTSSSGRRRDELRIDAARPGPGATAGEQLQHVRADTRAHREPARRRRPCLREACRRSRYAFPPAKMRPDVARAVIAHMESDDRPPCRRRLTVHRADQAHPSAHEGRARRGDHGHVRPRSVAALAPRPAARRCDAPRERPAHDRPAAPGDRRSARTWNRADAALHPLRCALSRALTRAARLARARGTASTLVIGVDVEPAFSAHAWVESGGRALLPPSTRAPG